MRVVYEGPYFLLQIKPEGPVGLLPRKVVQKAAEDYLSSIGQKEVEKVCFDSFAEADKLSLEKLDALIRSTFQD